MRIWSRDEFNGNTIGPFGADCMAEGDMIVTVSVDDNKFKWAEFVRPFGNRLMLVGLNSDEINEWLDERGISNNPLQWTSEQRILFELTWG